MNPYQDFIWQLSSYSFGKVWYGMHGRIKVVDLFLRRFGLFVVLYSFRYGPLVEHSVGRVDR